MDRAYLGVRFPGMPGAFEVTTLFTSALHGRDGGRWALVYRNRAEDLGRRGGVKPRPAATTS